MNACARETVISRWRKAPGLYQLSRLYGGRRRGRTPRRTRNHSGLRVRGRNAALCGRISLSLIPAPRQDWSVRRAPLTRVFVRERPKDACSPAPFSQSPRLEILHERPHSCLLFIVHLARIEVHEKDLEVSCLDERRLRPEVQAVSLRCRLPSPVRAQLVWRRRTGRPSRTRPLDISRPHHSAALRKKVTHF